MDFDFGVLGVEWVMGGEVLMGGIVVGQYVFAGLRVWDGGEGREDRYGISAGLLCDAQVWQIIDYTPTTKPTDSQFAILIKPAPKIMHRTVP